MTEPKNDWTHKSVELEDIRKIRNLYLIKIKQIDQPLFVNQNIFEDRLKSYFLTHDLRNVSREDVMNQLWNFHITQGYYVKIRDGEFEVHDEEDPNKYFVSFLEIDGPLGKFDSVKK